MDVPPNSPIASISLLCCNIFVPDTAFAANNVHHYIFVKDLQGVIMPNVTFQQSTDNNSQKLVPCSNAAKMRNPFKFAGVPQTNETISAASGPKFTILSGHVEEVLLFNKFFF